MGLAGRTGLKLSLSLKGSEFHNGFPDNLIEILSKDIDINSSVEEDIIHITIIFFFLFFSFGGFLIF